MTDREKKRESERKREFTIWLIRAAFGHAHDMAFKLILNFFQTKQNEKSFFYGHIIEYYVITCYIINVFKSYFPMNPNVLLLVV